MSRILFQKQRAIAGSDQVINQMCGVMNLDICTRIHRMTIVPGEDGSINVTVTSFFRHNQRSTTLPPASERTLISAEKMYREQSEFWYTVSVRTDDGELEVMPIAHDDIFYVGAGLCGITLTLSAERLKQLYEEAIPRSSSDHILFFANTKPSYDPQTEFMLQLNVKKKRITSQQLQAFGLWVCQHASWVPQSAESNQLVWVVSLESPKDEAILLDRSLPSGVLAKAVLHEIETKYGSVEAYLAEKNLQEDGPVIGLSVTDVTHMDTPPKLNNEA